MGRTALRWTAWEQRGRPVQQASPLAPVTYPTTRLRPLVEIAPGADLTADPGSWGWVDITEWVRFKPGISTVVGRRDQAGLVDPSRATLQLDNRDGRFSRRNPFSPYYGLLTRSTPIRLAVDPGDGMHYRYYGFVNEWPKRWDRSGNDSTVTITCGGQLRRLQRSQPLKSALTRAMVGDTIGDFSALSHWAMEDGSTASQFVSSRAGQPPAMVSGDVNLASYTSFDGSLPLPVLNTGGQIRAVMPTFDDTGIWQIQHTFYLPSTTSDTTDADLMSVKLVPGSGAVAEFRLTYLHDTGLGAAMRLTAYNSAGAVLDQTDRHEDMRGTPFLVSWSDYMEDTTHTTRVSFWDGDGERVNSITMLPEGFGLGSVGRIQSVTAKATAAATGWSFGQLALFTDPAIFYVDHIGRNARAAFGYVGEQAHERVIRVCREEGIQLRCTAGKSAALGKQPVGTALAVLRDAERADLGVLYEHEFGLGYKALTEYYNQPVQLELDFNQGHIGEPPEADDSDLRVRNQWTVSRSDGSSATVLDHDYDVADGLVDGSTTLNVETDEQLAHVAGWLVHRNTIDEDYWPGLKLRFARMPELIQTWTALPFGARLTVANPPSQADPGNIDAVIEGWTERWDPVTWEATLNTSPASVYRVAVYGDSGTRYDSRATTLAEDLDTTETGVDVTVASGNVGWITTATHPTKFPPYTPGIDIGIGGEQMTVTAIVSTGGGNYTFTVTRSVNGITKAHSSGASVRLWRPARYAL